MRLNLGAGDDQIEGFFSVDIAPPADKVVDLSGPWPWENSSVEMVIAKDVIEHIGDCGASNKAQALERWYPAWGLGTAGGSMRFRHPLGRIHFMNELWRVLKPGARATIETPNASRGSGYFQDCTHVSPWCLSSFKYFEHGAFAHTRLAKAYGITAAFRIIELSERETNGEDPREKAFKITAILEAVK